jgi:hypothetical protein
MGIINGELIFFQSDLTDVREKIVIATLVIPPESFVRDIQSRGGKALIMTGYPGMFLFNFQSNCKSSFIEFLQFKFVA